MNKNEKAELIAEAKELIQNATAVYLTDYSKINVAIKILYLNVLLLNLVNSKSWQTILKV